MSGTADGGAPPGPLAGEPAATSDEAAYFRTLEEAFVRLRGAPLLLSPADYQVAARWHREGVPSRLVEATLEEVFARRRDRGAKGRINSLRYCAPAVDAAWAEVREMQGPARREGLVAAPDADLRLGELADALPPGLPARDGLATRLRSLSGSAEQIESALGALDAEMLAAADADLDAEARGWLASEVEGILDGLRQRFPGDEVDALRAQLRRQRLRRLAGLPTLTLF
jgi:hypothetical protein